MTSVYGLVEALSKSCDICSRPWCVSVTVLSSLDFIDCTFSEGDGGAEGPDFQSLFPSGYSRGNEDVAVRVR